MGALVSTSIYVYYTNWSDPTDHRIGAVRYTKPAPAHPAHQSRPEQPSHSRHFTLQYFNLKQYSKGSCEGCLRLQVTRE